MARENARRHHHAPKESPNIAMSYCAAMIVQGAICIWINFPYQTKWCWGNCGLPFGWREHIMRMLGGNLHTRAAANPEKLLEWCVQRLVYPGSGIQISWFTMLILNTRWTLHTPTSFLAWILIQTGDEFKSFLLSYPHTNVTPNPHPSYAHSGLSPYLMMM